MMQTAHRQLQKSLTQFASVYKELLVASQATTDLLKAGDTQGLLAKTVEAEGLIRQAEVLEKQWLAILDGLLPQLGLPANSPLSMVAQRLESPAGPLHNVINELQHTVEQLQLVGATNRELLQQALDYVQFSLRALSDAVGVPTYAQGGLGRFPAAASPPGVVDLRG